MQKNDKQKTILLSAGASGGHVFPALAVAEELKVMGYKCVFVGNGKHFVDIVQKAGFSYYILPASPFNVKNPLRKLWALVNIMRAMFKAMRVVHKERPSVVFGTGGYATVAAVIAGNISGVPTMIHEQNVLPGRANKFLAKRVDKIALGFEIPPNTLKVKNAQVSVLGNPVRHEVLDAQKLERQDNGRFKLLVVGGSHGARAFSDVVPEAIALLPQHLRDKLDITQQARAEDLNRVYNFYTKLGVNFKVKPFFDNLPEEIVNANLVISRAGASSVCECALLGRAAIFVPLQLADGHQLLNAEVLVNENAALMIEAANFTPQALAQQLEELMSDTQRIWAMEQRAKSKARPDAAQDVAQAVVKLAKTDVMTM